MSIINQALKKAQREQLLRGGTTLTPLAYAHANPPRRWRWWLLAAGLLIAIGVGATFPSWLTAPSSPSAVTASRQAPPPVQAEVPAEPARPVVLPRQEALPEATPLPGRSTPPESVVTTTAPPAPLPPSGTRMAPRVVESLSATPPVATARQAALTLPIAVPPQPTTAAVAPVTPPSPPAAQERSRAEALLNRALVAQQEGKLNLAVTLLEQAIRFDPASKAAHNSLGNAYYEQQRYHQAVTMYERTLAIDPAYAKARNNLGNTYMQLAMDERAIEELQHALRIDRSYGMAYYNLACVHARGGKSAVAAQYLQQAIALEPEARSWAQTDADFAPVRSAPEVRQLLGP